MIKTADVCMPSGSCQPLLCSEMRHCNMFSHVCVCVSVSPVCSLTFECIDLQTSFLVHR